MLKIQLKGGIEMILKFNGMGIRNLWLNEVKGAIQLIGQGLENKVNQNFIFTHKTEQKEPKTRKRKLSFRKSFIKDKRDPTEDSLESSKLDTTEKSEDPGMSTMTPEQRLKYLEERVDRFKKNIKKLRYSNKKYEKREKEIKESIAAMKPFFEKLKEYMPQKPTTDTTQSPTQENDKNDKEKKDKNDKEKKDKNDKEKKEKDKKEKNDKEINEKDKKETKN